MTWAIIIIAASVLATILGFIAMASLRRFWRWVRSPRPLEDCENEMLPRGWEG